MAALLKESRNPFSVLEKTNGFLIKYKRTNPTARNRQVRG
jgi:hypothetical protein